MIDSYSVSLIEKPSIMREVKTTELERVRKIMIEQIKEQQAILRKLKIDSMVRALTRHMEELRMKEFALADQLEIITQDIEEIETVMKEKP